MAAAAAAINERRPTFISSAMSALWSMLSGPLGFDASELFISLPHPEMLTELLRFSEGLPPGTSGAASQYGLAEAGATVVRRSQTADFFTGAHSLPPTILHATLKLPSPPSNGALLLS